MIDCPEGAGPACGLAAMTTAPEPTFIWILCDPIRRRSVNANTSHSHAAAVATSVLKHRYHGGARHRFVLRAIGTANLRSCAPPCRRWDHVRRSGYPESPAPPLCRGIRVDLDEPAFVEYSGDDDGKRRLVAPQNLLSDPAVLFCVLA